MSGWDRLRPARRRRAGEMGQHILLTGGAGFIGSHVARRLLGRGDRVTVLDDFNDFYDPALKRSNAAGLAGHAGWRLVEGDIRDDDAVERLFAAGRFDTVVHLAARAGVRPSLQQARLYHDVNVVGTVVLLEAARRHGVRRFLFGSSSSVYGAAEKVPFSEDDPVDRPVSPYAASKLACEALGHTYHHVYGMDIAMLRFFTVYGPRQRPDLAIHKFARLIWEEKPLPVYGDGKAARDYTYVTDTVDGVIAVTQKEFGYRVFNLGESQTVQLWYLIDLLEKAGIAEADGNCCSIFSQSTIRWQSCRSRSRGCECRKSISSKVSESVRRKARFS